MWNPILPTVLWNLNLYIGTTILGLNMYLCAFFAQEVHFCPQVQYDTLSIIHARSQPQLIILCQ